jgi:Zn-dependent protease with chaperone function
MKSNKRVSFVAFVIGAPLLCLLVAVLALSQAGASVSPEECLAGGTPYLVCHLSGVGEILFLLSATGIAWPLLLIFAIARLCREVATDADNRRKSIAQAAPIVAGSIVAVLFIQGCTLALAIALIEALTSGHSWPIVGAAVTFGTLWTCWRLIDALFLQPTRRLAPVLAVPALPGEQSKLWATVRMIAEKAGTPIPAHILLGLYPTFYASIADFELDEKPETHRGTSLHLSMPLMRLLDQKELETILHHELTHLSREDPQLVWSFYTLMQRSEIASQAIGKMNLLNVLVALPAVTLLHYGITCFRTLDLFLKHGAELHADRQAADKSEAVSLISALVKVQFATGLWRELEQTAIANLEKGSAFINVSETFGTGAAREMKKVGPQAVFSAADTTPPGPAASAHPTFAQRCRNLGIAFKDVERALVAPARPSLTSVASAEQVERQLSQIYQRALIKSRRATLPQPPG